jgi:hypothetical protein
LVDDSLGRLPDCHGWRRWAGTGLTATGNRRAGPT